VRCLPYFPLFRFALLALVASPAWALLPTSTSCSPTPLQTFGGPITFVVAVNGSGSGTPTGTVTIFENGSAISSASLSSNGTAQITVEDFGLGSHTVTCGYGGDMSYQGSSVDVAFTIVRGVPVISLSASRNPSPAGEPVAIQIVLKPPFGAPSGAVTLIDGTNVLARLPLYQQGDESTAIFTTSQLAPGTHTLTASYEGDAFFLPAPAPQPLILVIGRLSATITIVAVNPNPSKLGQPIAVQVQAMGASLFPTGSVSVLENQATVGMGTLTNGAATVTLSGLGAGLHLIIAKYSGDANFDVSSTAPVSLTVLPGSLSVVLAGSLDKTIAPDSIVSVFGSFASATVAATLPLTTSLGGLTLIFRDGLGDHAAALYYVSPTQINAVVPAGLAPGSIDVILRNANGDQATGSAIIAAAAPGLLTVDGAPTGVAAATVETLHADGSVTVQDAFQCSMGKCVTVPIDLGSNGDQVFLTLFGTGIRHADTATLKVRIAEQDLTPSYAGAQPTFPGLDQVNVQLPSSLRGAGDATVSLVTPAQSSNAVKVSFK
jgi:uncharacterized protein (TIGR03437 family)